MPRRPCGAAQHRPNGTLRRLVAAPRALSSAAWPRSWSSRTTRRSAPRSSAGSTERGHAVASAPTGLAGLEHAVGHRPDVVVLDLGLPDVDGTAVLRMLRGVSQVPVIVATARDDEAEIVAVLDAGADDYVVKPFSAAQLDARIRAVLRRGGGGAPAGRRGRGRRAADRPAQPAGQRRRPPAGADAARVRPAALPRGARRAGGQQARAARPRCGSCPTGARTRPSTCTCRGCAASSGRPRSRPATCTASAASACGSRRPSPAPRRGLTGAPTCAAARRGHDLAGAGRVPRAAGAAGAHGRRPSARCSPRPPTPRRSPRSSPSPTPPRWPSPSPRSTPTSAAQVSVFTAGRRGARRRGAPHARWWSSPRGGAARPGTSTAAGRSSFAVRDPAGADRGDPHVRHRRGADRRGRPGLAAARRARAWCCWR